MYWRSTSNNITYRRTNCWALQYLIWFGFNTFFNCNSWNEIDLKKIWVQCWCSVVCTFWIYSNYNNCYGFFCVLFLALHFGIIHFCVVCLCVCWIFCIIKFIRFGVMLYIVGFLVNYTFCFLLNYSAEHTSNLECTYWFMYKTFIIKEKMNMRTFTRKYNSFIGKK